MVLKMNTYNKQMVAAAASVLGLMAFGDMMDRPQGFKIGQHMTLKPYVAVSASYDSNVDSRHDGTDDCFWTINPGLNLEYKADMWQLAANAFYQYNAYCQNTGDNAYDYHGYGENLTLKWADAQRMERGWAFEVTESYKKTNPTEDMSLDDGRGFGSDRQEFRFAGAVERRFAKGWHAGLNGSYYLLDYDNARNSGQNGLFGWDRWTAGAELGWAPSKWTDILLAGGYQGYSQDNNRSGYANQRLSRESDGWTLMAGLGSYATERISYRILGGWSRFAYGGSHGSTQNGFTYSASARYQAGDTWDTMLLASSYYQPSEREYGSCMRVDSLSWGIAKSWIKGKLTSTFDVAYRRETHEYSYAGASDYDLDILTFRLGLNYYLNRYLSIFGTAEYRASMCSGSSKDEVEDYYDYNRVRATLGMRLTY